MTYRRIYTPGGEGRGKDQVPGVRCQGEKQVTGYRGAGEKESGWGLREWRKSILKRQRAKGKRENPGARRKR
jgi:hypothetical protein